MSTKQLKKYELPMETPVIATPFVLIFCALHKQCISQNLVNLTQPIVGWWIKRLFCNLMSVRWLVVCLEVAKSGVHMRLF